MMPRPDQTGSEHAVRSILSSAVALAARPTVALLGSIWQQPMFYFGFLVPLSITVFGRSEELVFGIPPIIPISVVFLLVALVQGGGKRIVSAWQASPAVFWLYLLVVAIEVFLMFYHDNLSNWEWVAGRAAFFLVFLAAVASCENVEAAGKALRGLTYGATVIGLLTIVHALRIVHLPFATPLWAPRKFGPLQMPFPRTIGLAMTPDKFGMIAGMALATVIASSVGRERLIRSAWGRAALFVVVSLGSLIAQQRGVYLEVCLAIALSGYFLWMRTRPCPRFGGPRGSWFAAAAYALLLILSNLVFSAAPPEFILDAGSPMSVDNVLQRIDLNAAGWRLFKQAPLLGIGHGRFRELSLLPKGIHNHFWEHFVSTGLVGSIPYALFHMLILVMALRLCAHPQSMTRAVASILSVSVMVAYLAYQFAPMFFVSVFALICGLVVSASQYPGQARQTRTAFDAPNAGEDDA